MEKSKINITECINLENLTNEALAVAPDYCSGDACDVVALRATFNESGTVRFISASNSSSRTVNVSLDWADPFGYCGVTNSNTISPGGVVNFYAPTLYSPGYCRVRAFYN